MLEMMIVGGEVGEWKVTVKYAGRIVKKSLRTVHTWLATSCILCERSAAAGVLDISTRSTLVEVEGSSVDHGIESHERYGKRKLHADELLVFEYDQKIGGGFWLYHDDIVKLLYDPGKEKVQRMMIA